MKINNIKTCFTILSILILLGIEKNSDAQFIKSSADSNFYAIQANFLNLNLTPDTVESGLYYQYKTFENFWEGRLSPHGNFNIAARAYRNYAAQFTPPSNNTRSTAPWTCNGPFTSPSGWHTNGIGRIQAIAFDPDDATIIYAGSPFGGVFQSTDGGATWQNFYTDDQLPFTGVSDIVVCKDPNTNKKFVFIATGDGDAFATFSIGIYRLEIGVNTWTPINTGLFSSYENKKAISKLLVKPSDHNIMYVGTTDGIFKTTDALSTSPTWANVFQPTNSDNTYIKGLEFEPNDTAYNHIFASGIDIIQSYNGGSLWTSVTGNPSPYGYAFNGTKTTNEDIQLINISAYGDYLYAYVISNSNSGAAYTYRKIYIFNYNITSNTWNTNLYTNTNPASNGASYNGANDISITRMPIKALSNNDVCWGSTYFFKSANYGAPPIHQGSYFENNLHPDQHKFVVNGTNLYIGSDGGLSKSTNPLATSPMFTNLNGTGLAVGTIYRMSDAKHETNDIILIGEMDNGSHKKENASWQNIGSSDGGEQCVKNNMDMVSSDAYNNTIKSTSNNWSSSTGVGKPCAAWGSEWNAPIEYEPVSDKYYFGHTDLFVKTDLTNTNCTTSWQRISDFDSYFFSSCSHGIKTFKIAPSNNNYIYVGMNHEGTAGPNTPHCPTPSTQAFLFRTTSGGCGPYPIANCWTDITPSNDRLCGSISSIAIDPLNPNRLWISGAGFINGTETSHVMYSNDGGTTWSDFSTGLPDLPVLSIIYEKGKGTNDQLYIGTDAGVYYRNPYVNSWQKYTGLPNVIVNDLEINIPNNKIYAATMGRGLWEAPLVCPPTGTLTLSGNVSQNNFEEANGLITSTQTFNSGLKNTYRSSTAITLTPGFIATATTGSSFEAFIHGCDAPGNSFRKLNANNNNNAISQYTSIEKKESLTKNNIGIVPNPNNGNFRITVTKNDNAVVVKAIQVYDMMGKVIWENKTPTSNTFDVDISSYSQGVYYVRAINELGDIEITKLLKQ
ncbi:MAG: T9SS type A sorting domain-containing protein [Bacteroidetes bacterium]|nr:T9SS type A sorting domain-containing protein [Bacteroidota bacterium]